MIIGKAKLVKHNFDGDKEIFTHMSDNRELQKLCAEERKEFDPHFQTEKQRPFRKIASIPPLVFFKHPEFHNDEEALRRWLQTDEGRMYRTDR